MTANSMEKSCDNEGNIQGNAEKRGCKICVRVVSLTTRGDGGKSFDSNQIEAGHTRHSRRCANIPMAIFELFIVRTTSF